MSSLEVGSSFVVKVPATSANLGPGFDSLSLALRLYLTVSVSVHVSETQGVPENLDIFNRLRITYKGYSDGAVSTDPRVNLLTRAILHVAERAKVTLLPPEHDLHLVVHNDIPLGKGLGSSGATIVAGCIIANKLCSLHLDRIGLMKFALEIENHPDNISASIAGGFVVSGVDPTNREPFIVNTPISSHIKAVVVVPDIEKIGGTQSSRSVLPESYSKQDIIFNLQRTSLLTSLLSKHYTSTAELAQHSRAFATAMKDRIHQPYRQKLIPGLSDVLALTQSPHTSSDIGLLGICMSGAGPSVLALARDDVDLVRIGEIILACFKNQGVNGVYMMLDFDKEGGVHTHLM